MTILVVTRSFWLFLPIQYWHVYLQVSEDLLQELQAKSVITLLHKAISLVKEDHNSAMSVTLSMADTPVSSPTSQRKGLKHLDGKDASKVHISKTVVTFSECWRQVLMKKC